jgi:ribosome-associated protein
LSNLAEQLVETVDIFTLAALAANTAESKKAYNTIILETSHICPLADYFVITSGSSQSQIKAITQAIRDAFKAKGIFPMGEECAKGSSWHLLDYGDLVIHIMHPEDRQFYNLEDFWSHADPLPRSDWETRKAS